MSIDWMALVKVALVSLAFGIGIVTVFSAGIVGVSLTSTVPAAESGQGSAGDATAESGRRALGITAGVVCFGACAAAVLYGLWLIIPQFH